MASTTAKDTAAGGASWMAAAGAADESADSMWQHEPGEFRAVVVGAGPWQQPAESVDWPRSVGPRWQKQSPAEAFSNAAASTAMPMVRTRGFMKLSLA
jgi:hypothetical protein